LHWIEKLVPKMLAKAEQAGAIVVAKLGHQRLADGRLIELFLEAKLVQQDAGGVHQGR
jgi:hypothetical protein